MAKTRGKKGQVRVIETILASFVILFALSFVNIFAVAPTSPRYEATELEKLGYNVLYDLDKQRLLARFVYNEDWQDLRAALRVTLPVDVYFNMSVYDLDGNKINQDPIIYGDPATFATSESIVSVRYGLTGYPIRINATQYQANCDLRSLNLQLVRG